MPKQVSNINTVVEGTPSTERTSARVKHHSNSDTMSLRSAYSKSPIYTKSLTDRTCREKFRLVLENVSFISAPDLHSVPADDVSGPPASPFVPNPASSPTGLPSDQPAAPDGYGNSTSNSFGTGPTADAPERNPAVTSITIRNRTNIKLST